MMKFIIYLIGVIGFVILLSIIFAFPTMWLWNWLMPAIFGLCKINVWQAFGLTFLCGILFRGTSNKED